MTKIPKLGSISDTLRAANHAGVISLQPRPRISVPSASGDHGPILKFFLFFFETVHVFFSRGVASKVGGDLLSADLMSPHDVSLLTDVATRFGNPANPGHPGPRLE